MSQEDKLLKIIETYGVMEQLKYFQSEIFELNEAILARVYDYDGMTDVGENEHIAEEIADVIVMLMQFKEYYHIDGKDILKIMEEKIDRQIKRIEESENE